MDSQRVTFDFERLEVYQRALELVILADRLAHAFTGVRRHLGWQLHRAATSILLNLAEGAGRFRKLDKAQFYVIATGSAMECAAILDIADRLGVGSSRDRQEARAMIESVTSMLIRLARSTRERP